MKKSRQDIEMNYLRAMSVADELTDISYKIDDVINKDYVRIFSDIAGNWQGDNASVFVERGDDFILRMISVADEITKVSRNIKLTAETIYKAEKNAVCITY